MELRHLTNEKLFQLYDSDLVLRLHNAKNLSDTRKMLAKFKEYLGAYPPSPELAKAFLGQYAGHKPRTLYRYTQMLRVFLKWYGEPLELKVKVPKTLPPYTEDNDIEKLLRAAENKKTHKKLATRDILLIDLGLRSGLRRSELANLEPRDVHPDFLMVRNGKGQKDRMVPLPPAIAGRLQSFVKGMEPHEKVFKLKAPCITMKIKQFARKAGLEELHCHSLRHKYATDLLESGADIRALQQPLGHESLSTTQVYLAVTDKRLREAVLLLDERREHTPNNSDIFGPLAGKRLPMSWELPENLSPADRKRYYPPRIP